MDNNNKFMDTNSRHGRAQSLSSENQNRDMYGRFVPCKAKNSNAINRGDRENELQYTVSGKTDQRRSLENTDQSYTKESYNGGSTYGEHE